MGLGSGRTTNDRVIAVIQENAASLLRIARRHSLCADDAQDAYQRALEIYLERLDLVEEATAGQWLRTVCKHEAMRIRAQRQRMLGTEEVAWDAQPSVEARDAEERAVSMERVARAAEALQGCKPDEVTAMLLKADGSSYAEIGALTGWTYSKVNRCLAEGRARFLRRYADIDSGAACEEWALVLSAIADGQARAEDLTRVRPHLRHCAACRATLKALHASEPVLGALVPAGLLVTAQPGEVSGIVARAYEALATGLGERVARLHAAIELATSSKAAAVVASTAAMAAGGAAAADRVGGERLAPRERAQIRVEPERQRPPRPVPIAAASVARTPAAPEARPAQEARHRRTAAPRGRAAPDTTRAASPQPTPDPRPAPTPEFAFEAEGAPGATAAATRRPASDASSVPAPPTRQQTDRRDEFGFEG